MRAFDRELDELEEWIVYFALIFLFSSILLGLGRFLGPLVIFPVLAQILSFIAAIVAVLLWILRRFGSPLYARLRNPEKSQIQTIMSEKTPPADK